MMLRILLIPNAADAAGFNHYWKVGTGNSKKFRAGNIVLARDASDYRADFRALVTNIIPAGANSYIVTKSLEAAPRSGSTYGPGTVDTLLGIGNANPEGGTRPEAIHTTPVKRDNYTQIFRDALSITRTRSETEYRTESGYKKDKKFVLSYITGLGMEKAFLWGVKSETIGPNGKPMRTLQGIIPDIKDRGVSSDFSIDTSFDGLAWTAKTGGYKWLNEHLEEMFRHGSRERLGFAGSGAILGINELAAEFGQINIVPGQTSFGMAVMEWITPFGVITLYTHPLYSFETTNRNSITLFEPSNIDYKFITDTMFKADNSDKEGGGDGDDAKNEEYLTECTLEFSFPETGAQLEGVGIDNP